MKATNKAGNPLLVPNTEEGEKFVQQLKKYLVNGYGIWTVFRGKRNRQVISKDWIIDAAGTLKKDAYARAVYLTHKDLDCKVTAKEIIKAKKDVRRFKVIIDGKHDHYVMCTNQYEAMCRVLFKNMDDKELPPKTVTMQTIEDVLAEMLIRVIDVDAYLDECFKDDVDKD